MNNRQKLAVGFSVISFPVMLFFQNCGQAGAIGAASATESTQATKTSGDTLVIQNPNNSTHPENLDEDHKHSNVSKCHGIQVSDILLKINGIKADTLREGNVLKRAAGFEIVDADSSLSLDKLTLKIKATTSGIIGDFFVGLEKVGHKILTPDNHVHDLKTSDIEIAGFKVNLKSRYSVEAGKTYQIKFDLVTDSKSDEDDDCEVKPKFKEASLTSTN